MDPHPVARRSELGNYLGRVQHGRADDSIHVWGVRGAAAPATLSGLTSPVSIAWGPGSQTLISPDMPGITYQPVGPR